MEEFSREMDEYQKRSIELEKERAKIKIMYEEMPWIKQ
jgi:hypothetical protein